MTTKIPVELSSTPGIVDGSNATAITIDSSENVGIGTTSPDSNSKLDVNGNLYATRLFVDAGGNGSDPMIRVSTDTNTGIFFPANDTLAITTGGSERMRFTSTGQIAIGTTTPTSNGGTGAGLIHLHGGSAEWAVLHCTNPSFGTSATDGVLIGMISDDVYLFSYESGSNIFFGVNNGIKGKFDSSGTFFTTDGNVSSLSDKRIKKNITPVAEGLDVVKKLNPINFEYCNTYEGQQEDGLGVDDGRIHKGFIADEVQEVAPSYVEETNGIVLNEEVDDLKTLSMTAMIPMLVKSIQELSAKVEELESKIDG